jgi:cytochrome b561
VGCSSDWNTGGVGRHDRPVKVALLALIVLHVLAVQFHRFVLKTDVMQRMIRPPA